MIRVICADLSGLSDGDYRRLYEKATPERRARADRYIRREDALRCVAADALLRYALGGVGYTAEKREGGKPWLPEHPDFHFNLSHAGRWVVLACGDSEVGVDVEELRPGTDTEAIARRFFTPEEQRYVLEAADPLKRFFEVWTAKESYLKYLGTGLRGGLGSFSVLSELPVRLHRRILNDGSPLCLCTTETDYSFELPDVQRLK